MQIGVETAKALDNKRLFVVANDDITRMALQFMLHDENETHDLPTLEAAFDKGVEWKPDLLLLGIDVVAERGVEVLALVRSRLAGAKILLVADSRDDPLVATCQGAGIDGLLVKPLRVEDARRKVDGLVGRKRAPIPIHTL
ncbi:MAG: response regulator [Gammaproteobacteria bacterium]|jgi:DNA-binding NarL/FixJ family response regulator|nr:response regulator [Gammaproteobacteria bacterium]MBU1407747.1 response regulator [Gammaproteobacteria bacterium]MBU1531860.1 response regulator [Gammaproteobacteria bacterium]